MGEHPGGPNTPRGDQANNGVIVGGPLCSKIKKQIQQSNLFTIYLQQAAKEASNTLGKITSSPSKVDMPHAAGKRKRVKEEQADTDQPLLKQARIKMED
jgi:hypothetical protein